MNVDENDQILRTTCMLGKIMLESGAEIFRVEETMEYFCDAYGVLIRDISVTPTEIVVSIVDVNGVPRAYMRRVKSRSLNLNKVKLVNDFSQELACGTPPPIRKSQARLRQIAQSSSYRLPVMTLATGLGTGSFAIVFGGTYADFISGFFVGMLLRLFMYSLNRLDLHDMFSNLAGGVVAASLGWFAVFIGVGHDWEIITISALTLLFPGLLLTNALRDVASGDLVSGISHTVEAFSIAAALAGGAAFIYSLLSQIGGVTL